MTAARALPTLGALAAQPKRIERLSAAAARTLFLDALVVAWRLERRMLARAEHEAPRRRKAGSEAGRRLAPAPARGTAWRAWRGRSGCRSGLGEGAGHAAVMMTWRAAERRP